MNLPTLSVILPNYNHAHYIGTQLQAILSQSYPALEVIVIDDCSTDNSVEVIESFAQKYTHIRLFCNEQNQGVIASINRGLALASGDYIYSTASDDLVLDGFFEKSLNLLTQYPETPLCCSHPAFLDDATGKIDAHEDWFHLSEQPCYVSPEELVKVVGTNGLWIAGHTCIIKRQALIEAGQYFPELKWYCDWFLFHVVAFRYGICYLPNALAALRVISTSYSSQGMKDSVAQKIVMKVLVNLLKSETYHDVLPMFQKSDVLSNFPLVKTLVRAS